MPSFPIPTACLYKYRGDIVRDVYTLMNNHIYVPLRKDLNDPNESSIILQKCKEQAHFVFDHATTENDRSSAKAVIDTLKSFENDMGVYSLSKNYDIESMWAHYANGHRGFCIGYNAEKLNDFFNHFDNNSNQNEFHSFMEVKYENKRSNLDLKTATKQLFSYEDMKRFIQSYFYSKSKSWENEQEVRIVFFHGRIFIPVPKECVQSIYIGAKCPEENKQFILHSLSQSHNNINFFQMTFDNDSYKLTSNPINI